MKLEVITPTGTTVTADIEEVTAPGVRGEFGVLPGHTPFVSALRPGVLRYKKSGEQKMLAVRAGYIEVSGEDRIVVLVQAAMRSDDIDASKAKSDLESADSALRSLPDTAGRMALEAERGWAQARLDARTRG